jgi:hypothetical protein
MAVYLLPWQNSTMFVPILERFLQMQENKPAKPIAILSLGQAQSSPFR